MRKLPLTAAEDLLEIIMRRYERTSTLLTSNRPVEDWGKLVGDVAAVTAMLDRILHHGRAQVRSPELAYENRGHDYGGRTMTSPLGGFAPATPLRPNQNLPMKAKQQQPAPSRWSGPRICTLLRACGKRLLKLATKGYK
jgi:hypothetical protein